MCVIIRIFLLPYESWTTCAIKVTYVKADWVHATTASLIEFKNAKKIKYVEFFRS